MKYKVIYADPPWSFSCYSHKGKGRSAEAHYDCMTLDDIKALPVSEWAADDCALLLWATDPMLEKAFEVIKAWGFTYKTVGFYWAKQNKSGNGFFMGTGYYTRCLSLDSPVYIYDRGTRRVERTHIGSIAGKNLEDLCIWTHNGWKQVTNYVENTTRHTTIKTRLGKIVCSPEHKFAIKRLRRKGGSVKGRTSYHSIEFDCADNIRKLRYGTTHKRNGLNLLFSTRAMESPVLLSHYGGVELIDDMGWLVGLFCAEGHFPNGAGKNNGVRLSINKDETRFLEKIKDTINSLSLKSERYKNRDVNVASYAYDRTDGMEVCFYSKIVRDFISSFITGGRQTTRRLNIDLILQTPASFRLAILRGYLDGDGTKGEYGWEGFRAARSSCEDLINDIIVLAESVGVMAQKEKPYYGKCSNGKYFWSYGLSLPSPRNKSLSMDGTKVVPVRIDDIDESAILSDTCDITVDGGTFITGGIITHNSNPEQCLLATRGKPKRLSRSVQKLVVSPRREHSRKPDCVRERIEALFDGPYLEMFARSTKQGWDAWGNEISLLDDGSAPVRRWHSSDVERPAP